MPSSPTPSARDQRIFDGYRAGATIPELALAEDVSPQVVHRVVRAAGITVLRGALSSASSRCRTNRSPGPPR